jgi:hypothetical protein
MSGGDLALVDSGLTQSAERIQHSWNLSKVTSSFQFSSNTNLEWSTNFLLESSISWISRDTRIREIIICRRSAEKAMSVLC